jgi:hypothetical protein
MDDDCSLRYHAESLRILGVRPEASKPAVDAIREAEARCGNMLPAAVREYYSLLDADELLTLGDDICGAVPLETFLARFVDNDEGEMVEFFGPRRVNTGYQGFVVLDGSDDPPVEADGAESPVSFSQFVLSIAKYKATGQFD